MSRQEIILTKGRELISALKGESHPARADRIEDIIEDRLIWDKMEAKLASELDDLLANVALAESSRLIARVLSDNLRRQSNNPYAERVYLPAKQIAAEVGALGNTKWQKDVEDLIVSSTSSTEIFMGLRWHLNNLLKSVSSAPKSLQERVVKLRDDVDNSLRSVE